MGRSFLLGTVLAFLVPNIVFSTPADVEAVAVSDGPYVLIQSDTAYEVMQVCADSLTTMDLRAAINSTVSDNMCIDDSRPEYALAKAFDIHADSLTGVTRIFAVSDIHGEFDHLFSLLQNAGVISYLGTWTWGDGHLVVDGDIFDRGDQVTECLWLLYRLESEAKKAGGDVHVLLGNHELMIMRGDYRYLNEKYTKYIVAKSHMDLAELYGPESVLGRWLRSKNSAVKINDIMFVHGGLSPEVIHRGYSIHEMNEEIREGIDLSKQDLAADSSIFFLLRGDGPLWYRGYHVMDEGKPPGCTPAQLDSILSYYGVSTVVVGHTEEPEVCAMYGGKVIALDVPTDELGSLQGMLWQDGRFHRVDGNGERTLLR